MRVRVKLNVRDDRNLITLYQNPAFPFVHMLKAALKSYVEDRKILPVTPLFPEHVAIRQEIVNFSLNPKKDAQVINWLKSVTYGQRSSAIKNILKCSLTDPCLNVYFDNGFSSAPTILATPPGTSPAMPRPASPKTSRRVEEEVARPQAEEKKEKPAGSINIFDFKLE